MGLVLTRYGRRGDSRDGFDPRAEPLIFDNPQISDIYLGPAVPNILIHDDDDFDDHNENDI